MRTPLDSHDAIAGHDWRLIIGGRSVPPLQPGVRDSIDPATERELAPVPEASVGDVAAAVESAKQAFATWRGVSARSRAAFVRELAQVARENREELAFLDAVDAGLPITTMRDDVDRGALLMDLFADWALDLAGQTIPASAEHLHYTVREPFGVVGRIVPFNHPIMFALGKIAAPLVAGNTVVLKPAVHTSLSALRFGELVAEVLPPGVLNVVTGDVAGRALVAHPDVRRLAFIGSDIVGRAIQRDAATSAVKTVTLELGGKNAMIVLPDADLDLAAAGAVDGMNFVGVTGQSCGSNSRLIVHPDIRDELVARIVHRIERLIIGSPIDDATQVGPLVSSTQRGRTEDYVALGIEAGGVLRVGGSRPPEFERGYYYLPTVLTDVRPDSRLGQEEVFGPVLSVMDAEDLSTAIDIANSVEFGLTASVWTNDLRSAHHAARELDAGYVWVNGSSRHFFGVPFGGTKLSGVGREEGLEELLSFTQTKAVNVLLG